MHNFEYAHPTTETEAIELLTQQQGGTAILAAGMDLVPLMQKRLLSPERVVDISRIESLQGIHLSDDGLVIGSLTTLEELSQHPALADRPGIADVIAGIRAIQVQQTGTIGGDLCHLPNCWYFRSGYGLLGLDTAGSLPEIGDNRYHAIFGNDGPAKFVSASRFAPVLIALDAEVRIVGPQPTASEWLPLSQFYRTPLVERHGVTVMTPGQFLTHVRLPLAESRLSATYEVLESEGLDWPLTSAAVSLQLDRGLVRRASVVLGHVAPQPWISRIAADALIGRAITAQSAAEAGSLAVTEATPLSNNSYKVQLARTSVERALLRATQQLEGGL